MTCRTPPVTMTQRKTLARSIGEFVGHIVKAVRTDARAQRRRWTVARRVQEQDEGNVVLRRTTIDEVEIRRDDGPAAGPADPDQRSEPPPCP